MGEQRAEPAAGAVTVRAPAKINLVLSVGPVRPDGYHPLETVYQAVSLYDDVTVTEAERWSVQVTGDASVDLGGVPADESNIAIRAGRLLAAHHGLERGARIEIHKGIPVAGGLAGGSADAAATLVALDRLWGLDTADEALLALAGQLGSDVPFALLGGTAHGTGRGELTTPLTDNGSYTWVIVPNRVGLSTPTVYAAYDLLERACEPRVPPELLDALRGGDPRSVSAFLSNDLQAPALDLRPDLVGTLRDGLECGAAASMLSGSGPTVVLMALDVDDARTIAQAMTERGHADVRVVHGPVAGAHVVTHD